MVNQEYRKALDRDTLEQFRGKPNLEVLHDALARQLQEVYECFAQLNNQRDLYTAIGAQLNGIGEIAVLTRMEAGRMAGNPIPFNVIDDEMYRQYLIWKVLKNTTDCTYPDIIKAFRMFWDKPLYYTEDLEQPATMIFDTGEMEGPVDTRPLFNTPLLRAAGVTLKLYARTKIPMKPTKVYITPHRCETRMISVLPELHPVTEHRCAVYATPYMGRAMAITRLPQLEPAHGPVRGRLRFGASAAMTIMQTRLPMLEPKNEEETS